MTGYAIQLGDSFRDKPVQTENGPKKHIMFVIAENKDDVLVVPMDSIPCDGSRKYPQKDEFPLSPNDYNYNRITKYSFINYLKAAVYSKMQLDILFKDYEIDRLEKISPEFLKDLRDKGKNSRFLKRDLKKFLEEN